MKYKLKMDMVIPAGTVFHQAPKSVRRYVPFISHVFSIGPDSTGEVVLPIESDDDVFNSLFTELPMED